MLANGHPALGSWLMYPDAFVAESMARAGWDWLLVDMEHSPMSLPEAAAMVTAIRTTDVVPYIRPAWNDPAAIQQALDLGCAGIIVPVVNSADDAKRVVSDARFPPLGQRSRGGMRPILAFETDAMTYAERSNNELVVLVQIETTLAVQNVEAICAVEGVDGVFLGPNDLAASRGQRWPDAWADEDYRSMVRRVAAVALEHEKIAGFLARDPGMAVEAAEMGYRFIGVSSDINYLTSSAKASVNATWDALGYEAGHGDGHNHEGHDHGDHDHGDHDHDHDHGHDEGTR
jgi:4-hydroxy-2-oxoheptanedioate aldolase